MVAISKMLEILDNLWGEAEFVIERKVWAIIEGWQSYSQSERPEKIIERFYIKTIERNFQTAVQAYM